MVVAQEEYKHLGQEEKQYQQQAPKTQKKPKPKSRKFEKIMIASCLGVILALSLLLLLRYVGITEARHRVHNLGNELEQLEVQKEHLRVEVERASKSKWIEQEAKERLNLQYPTSQQMNYIQIDVTQVALVNQVISTHRLSQHKQDQLQHRGIKRLFGKIFSLIRT
ncbi:hypothetical protein Amet_2886 [Alkaliphilus metalliredigens QYMF]|uniref:Cell division protein FtsL n=1 Tax=Alkaliphilus metalliredigens (strain QYMF) TaxID=293826 RepID=A6TS68_ALKMQ|nr:hypothetical protein [Alkaliphilus metalliredigens]ABR49036.1 hypothetical protein Amet_2886 [Alkaliphilus metalliredigens QYMF]